MRPRRNLGNYFEGLYLFRLQQRTQQSGSCQTVLQPLRRRRELGGFAGFSSDDKNLGHLVEINRGPDGNIQSMHGEVGRFLGLGSNVVIPVNADSFEQQGPAAQTTDRRRSDSVLGRSTEAVAWSFLVAEQV